MAKSASSCPHCSSTNITYGVFNDTKYKCHDCEHKWTQQKEEDDYYESDDYFDMKGRNLP